MIADDMKTRGKGGAIVNVSSVLANTASSSCGVYCASKGAVDQLTRSMAVEFGPYNIRVNSVNPTVVRTRMAEMEGLLDKDSEIAQDLIKRTPLKRFADPEDVVNPILFLLSDKAAMITGITLPVDGGIAVSFN
ncbi:L-xylulose reductase [Araneus ventricosus]|uniref:L-xylulose reductase n=1 Tax=Araneus ventricosus TaxID=182803 RepID=A0A4Y2VXD5_ARAVE|nr:L-xylulose reductase [Araneus ventricosus]